MLKTKINQKGFAAVEALLVVVILAIIGGTGYYVYHTNKKSNDTLSSASKEASSIPSGNKATNADKKAILAAIKTYESSKGAPNTTTYTVNQLVKSNARGDIRPATGTSSQYIAHKDNNVWTIVYTGDSAPGKTIGTQYALPSGWFDANR